MGKHGVSLGADLYELWSAGDKLLPAAADALTSAWTDVPYDVTFQMTRGGGVGAGPTGPSASINAVLDDLNLALSTSAANLRDTGTALMWLADEYAKTDNAAAAEFHRKQKVIP